MNQKRLSETLQGVVEDCVNSVGVDLNTASPSLLSYISGIKLRNCKKYCGIQGNQRKVKRREELKKVKKLGDKTFEQCAGFLRIPDGDNVLDNTSVHPESYEAAKKLLDIMGYSLEDVKNRKLDGLVEKVEKMGMEKVAREIGVGVPTLKDIIKEL